MCFTEARPPKLKVGGLVFPWESERQKTFHRVARNDGRWTTNCERSEMTLVARQDREVRSVASCADL